MVKEPQINRGDTIEEFVIAYNDAVREDNTPDGWKRAFKIGMRARRLSRRLGLSTVDRDTIFREELKKAAKNSRVAS